MLPFEDSRRLTGGNLFFASTGAVLETAGVEAVAPLLEGWRTRVARARRHLGWVGGALVARSHASGTSLAIPAPCDVLFVATEVNEWAWCATLLEHDAPRYAGLEAALLAAALEDAAEPALVIAPVLEERAALERFGRLAAREARPRLTGLVAAANARALPHTLDEELLTLGAGYRSRSFAVGELPGVGHLDWAALGDIPTAIVTGSNGKTTSVRLLAACARAHGWPTAFNCTDGVFLDEEPLASGDYSGPAGARQVLREARAHAAILETARGGILRRGIAASRARVALVTNVSADHFGEYGIDDLEGLADVKLSVAGLVPPDGLLVLNADDPVLLARAGMLAARFGRALPLGWFALDWDHPTLIEHRARGGATAGVDGGRLRMSLDGTSSDLGAVATLPLTVGGSAAYNVANLLGAALAAAALGIRPGLIAAVFSRFGTDPTDNPGRLMRFEIGGVGLIVDYAHNPEGLRGLLTVARHLGARHGRLGLLLGHAGNRQDADLVAVARVAAAFAPDLIVVKEDEAHLRGRAPGEIPAIIRRALIESGMPAESIPLATNELEAVRIALEWARPGDVLALPVHSSAARAAVLELLRARAAR